MTERKAAFTPVDDPEVIDDVLNEAAAAAVKNETPVVDEPVEDEKDEKDEKEPETNGDGLPTDHKVRSDLGRKFSALHRRQDEFDAKIDRLIEVMTNNQKQPDPFEEDEPLTKSQMREYYRQLREEELKTEQSQKSKYQNSYDNTLVQLSSDYSQEEANAIFNELQTMLYNPTNDGSRDAEINFLKAERAYLRKKTANPKKDVPLKKDTPTGVITSQKAHAKDAPDVKLSAAGASYLDFVARQDGAEKAASLKKSLA